jgi:hypothetical protein
LSVWQELVAEFRALGGTLDNLRLDNGPLGRGLFPIERGRAAAIHVPENLLVDSRQIVFENGALKVAPGAGMPARERSFFEAYHARLSFGGGGRAEIERLFEDTQTLPEEFRARLDRLYRCGPWFAPPAGDSVGRQFVESREYGYSHGDVMMPFIELANHGHACRYDTDGGIWLRGTPEEEATAPYSATDAYGLFRGWGFACEAPLAFSMEHSGSIGGETLFVARPPGEARSGGDSLVPKAARAGGAVHVEFVLLGNRRAPGLGRRCFARALGAAGFGHGEIAAAFAALLDANLRRFRALLAEAAGMEGVMARNLQRMARLQLEALECCDAA